MRIMLDTNIFVFIYVFNSKLLKNILVNISKNHTLVISTYIIEELYKVVKEEFPFKLNSLINLSLMNKSADELFK